MQPFLLVGVGGSGGKTLRAVKQELQSYLRQLGWTKAIPAAWQFLHIDSPRIQDGADFPADFLNNTEYLSLVPDGVSYADIYKNLIGAVPNEFKHDTARPLPNPEDVQVSVDKGAGQFRAIGRTIAASAMSQIYAAAKSALTRMDSPQAKADLQEFAKRVNADEEIGVKKIIIVSSIAGGSGAGMFLDVTEAVKSATGGALYSNDVSFCA
jgi:hypothetical protein